MHHDLQGNLHVLHGGGWRHQIYHSQEVPKPQTHRFRGSRDRLVSFENGRDVVSIHGRRSSWILFSEGGVVKVLLCL